MTQVKVSAYPWVLVDGCVCLRVYVDLSVYVCRDGCMYVDACVYA